MRLTTRSTAALALAIGASLLVGCADDQEDAVEETDETRLQTAAGTSDPTAYCLLSQELSAATGRPTDAQLGEIENVAPPEIRDAVVTIIESVGNEDVDAAEVQEAEAELEAWEAENCDQPEASAPDENDAPGQLGGVEPPEESDE